MCMLVYYQFNTCSALYHHLLSQSHIYICCRDIGVSFWLRDFVCVIKEVVDREYHITFCVKTITMIWFYPCSGPGWCPKNQLWMTKMLTEPSALGKNRLCRWSLDWFLLNQKSKRQVKWTFASASHTLLAAFYTLISGLLLLLFCLLVCLFYQNGWLIAQGLGPIVIVSKSFCNLLASCVSLTEDALDFAVTA